MTERAQPSPMRFYATLMIGVGFIAIGIMLFIFLQESASASADLSVIPLEVDFPAPLLNLKNLAGDSVSIQQYAEKIVLVNLWATWCPPCKDEMPALQSYYQKHKEEGFVLIAIDQEEPLDAVQPFVSEFRLTFPVWLDQDGQAQRKFNTISMPSSFVIDRSGQVRLTWVGGVSEEFLERYVTKLIKE
jgi:peroxiredoxin